MKDINVLIVDDSAVIRSLLREILESDPDINVVGTAPDAHIARDKIKRLNPDVLTLDVEMPRMNGISFLKNIMRLRPMPVVMISTVTALGAPATIEALEIGAVDYVSKPHASTGLSLSDQSREIIDKVKTAAVANLRPMEAWQALVPEKSQGRVPQGILYKPNSLCAIGASTGGTEAIKDILINLPADMPPIVMVQHIPEAFSASFATRLNKICELSVVEAKDGQLLERGCAYLAPGDDHLTVVRESNKYVCRLTKSALFNRHRPSVDVLFDSVAEVFANDAVGVVLTGMGCDGAAGLLKMKESGAHTLVQDVESSVVWGMPGAAVELKATDIILPINRIAQEIIKGLRVK